MTSLKIATYNIHKGFSQFNQRAVLPIKRMLDFAKQINLPTRGIGNA